MTTEELKEELRKQAEKEQFSNMVKEYKRVRKIICDCGDLAYDEVLNIAMEICKSADVFSIHRHW